jgi:arsenite-transporting ATPase
VLPASVSDAYFGEWKELQARNRREIEESFAPVPILDVTLMEREVTGQEALGELARALYGDRDPADIYFRGQTQTIEQRDGESVLTLRLPFTSKAQVHLLTSGDELVVHVGQHKRNVILPRALVGLETTGAQFEGDTLTIRFATK